MTARPYRRDSGHLPAKVSFILNELAANRRHGAHELSVRALRSIGILMKTLRAQPPAYQRHQLRVFATKLRSAQPAMGSFLEWSRELEQLSREEIDPRISSSLRKWERVWTQRLRMETGAAVRHAVEEFPPGARVLTLSRSDTVFRTLTGLGLARAPAQVVVLRSEPGGEGAVLANDLVHAGLSVSLIEDHQGASRVADADLLLVGADAIFEDGSLIHKVGTRHLAEAAREYGVPTMSVTGLSKWVSGNPPHAKPPPLFDRTPAREVRGYWTDGGLLRPSEVSRVARQLLPSVVTRPRVKPSVGLPA